MDPPLSSDDIALSGILLLGLDQTNGPYIYHQYPPGVAAQEKKNDDASGEPDDGHQKGGNKRSVFSTIKNFTEVFLPRQEITGRVCWHYEADTTHIIEYIALEFSDKTHYTRNLLRVTICFVFSCPPMMSTSSPEVEEVLCSYAVALLNVAELFKDFENRYGYLFHFFDPLGEFYDPDRSAQSSMKPQETTVQINPHASTGGVVVASPLQQVDQPLPQVSGNTLGTASLDSSVNYAAPPALVVTEASTPPHRLPAAHAARLLQGDMLTLESFDIGSDIDQANAAPVQPSTRGRGAEALLRRIYYGGGGGLKGRSSSARLAHTTTHSDNASAPSGGGGGLLGSNKPSQVTVAPTALGNSFLFAPNSSPANHASNHAAPPAIARLPLSAPSVAEFADDGPMGQTEETTTHPPEGEQPQQHQPDMHFIDLYDLSFIVEKVLECVWEECDAIPLSEKSSVTVRCGKRLGGTGAVPPIYPDQRVVPIVSPAEVMAWAELVSAGESSGHDWEDGQGPSSPRVWAGWSDLTVTDVYEGVDGVRTVEEVVLHYCRRRATPIESWVWELLYTLHPPTPETFVAGCKRGSLSAKESGHVPLHMRRQNERRLEKRQLSMADMQKSAAHPTAAATSGDPPKPTPSLEKIPRRVLYALEALQHLLQSNWVRILDPITSSSVYVCTPKLYAVLSDASDPVRDILGTRLLAVNQAVQNTRPLPPQKNAKRQAGDGPPHRDDLTQLEAALENAGLQNASLTRRTDSTDGLADPGLVWEGLSPSMSTGTPPPQFGSMSSPSTCPQDKCHNNNNNNNSNNNVAAAEEIADTPAERQRIGRILNLAAQQGYHPSAARRTRRPTPPPHSPEDVHKTPSRGGRGTACTPSQQRSKGEDSSHTPPHGATEDEARLALQEEVELAASAALSALTRFQFCSVAAVTAQMRSCRHWKGMLSGWAPECVVALIEFGLLNGWLSESDGS